MNIWEAGVYLTVAILAMWPLLVLMWRRQRGEAMFGLIMLLLILAAAAAWSRPRESAQQPLVPPKVADGGFVSSDSCRSCHPSHYASWHRTFHRTMTQLATPQSVVAPFDKVVLHSRNRSYYLYRRGDEFWIRMPDPDWEAHLQNEQQVNLLTVKDPPMVERQIVMTTGSHHMQGYWVNGRGNAQLRQIPWYYLIDQERWVPREDVFLTPPVAERHFKLWNSSCIRCHAVAGNPGLETVEGRSVLTSKVAELGISCEACHGPADQHVQQHSNPLRRYRQHYGELVDDTIINPLDQQAEISVQICGQCHSNHVARDALDALKNGYSYRAGGDWNESYRMIRLDDLKTSQSEHERFTIRSVFWKDGTCRVGGDEVNGMVLSPCYEQGTGSMKMSCLSCHSMHDSDPNDQLAAGMAGNEACFQCHSSYRSNLEEHTHHPAQSSGSLCYNCHMPHTSYALFTAMRSHRIDNPDIASSAGTGRPNACNLCHIDKTLEWSAGQLTQWYGAPDVELSEDEKKYPASLLWLLKGNAAQRVIAAWHMSWQPATEISGNGWQAPFVAQLLDDPYAAVRFVAHESLTKLPGFEEFDFDFVRPAAARTKAKARAIKLWDNNESRSILIADTVKPDRDGKFSIKSIQYLIDQRDETPTDVPE